MIPDPHTVTVLESLNSWLKQAMIHDDRVLLMGEDIQDPYGGAFKVTRSLSELFPDRVISTPISEAAMLGVATGLALRGFRVTVLERGGRRLFGERVLHRLPGLHRVEGEPRSGSRHRRHAVPVAEHRGGAHLRRRDHCQRAAR
mgnify:CR=1 FL=1